MEREEMKEEETIEVRIDKEVDKETSKKEEGGEEEEIVMIIGAEVTDKKELIIRNRVNIKIIFKILINKMKLEIQIKIHNLKNEDLITMIMITLEKEIHIIKIMTVEIVKNKEDSMKMAFKKEIVKNQKHNLTLIQIIDYIM
jgi:hypothetical protein